MQATLCLLHKLGYKADTIEWNKLESAGADLADCGGQATSILLIHKDAINSDEHRGSQNTSKVLWVSDLVKEKVELTCLILFIPHRRNISYPLNFRIVNLGALHDYVLMRAVHSEAAQFSLYYLESTVNTL